MSERWTALCSTSDALPGESVVAWLDDTPILVVNYDGQFYAMEDKCSHEDFELSAGAFDPDKGEIECVLHGARFDVRNGDALCAPAYEPVQTFTLKVADGMVWVREPD